MKMKRIALLLSLLLTIGAAAQPLTQWTMHRQGDNKTYNVTVPTTVAGALNEAGAFGANVLDEDRYFAIDKSQFDSPWVFTTRFDAAKGLRQILRFDGLGYSADIKFNGTLIASADTTVGFFSVREFDVTALAKKRHNTVEVTVHKAPAKSLNSGYADWNPRPVDESMGIVRGVELIQTPDVEIQDLFVIPEVNPDDLSKAAFTVRATLINRADTPVDATMMGVWDDGSYSKAVSLAAGEQKEVSVRCTVDKPRIWWSHDLGKPELYNLTVRVGTGDGRSRTPDSHVRSVRFGLRSITSEIDENGHRQLILNGKKILFKAGGWSDDIFMQDTPEKTRAQLVYVRDMGLNGVRFENIWGRDDTVYDLCDELGLVSIVGFSCHWEWKSYCGLDEVKGYGCIVGEPWESLAARYFHDQVIRLHNHPSILAWLTGSDRIPTPSLEERYLADYARFDYRPYICSAKGMSSLAGPSGVKMEGPYEYVGPDYWYRDTKRGGAYGFNTETGIGMNIPQKENVERLLGGEPAWPIGPAWDYHCTASSSHMNNTKIEEAAVAGTYGEADSFEDFVKKAHALDYDSTRSMYEAFRCNIGKATGIVNWMLNSAWPSLYWQLYDWYGVPTAGYYGVKHACAPVQLIYNYGDRTVYAVNDAAPEARHSADIVFLGAGSRKLIGKTVSFASEERKPVKLEKLPAGVPGFLSLVLKDASGSVVARNFYCIPAKNGEYAWDKADWWGIPMTAYADLSFVSALPKADVTLETTPVDGGISVKLTNNSEVVSFQNILKAFGADGKLIGGPVWEDNFISLLPGESRTVLCTAPGAEIKLDSWN